MSEMIKTLNILILLFWIGPEEVLKALNFVLPARPAGSSFSISLYRAAAPSEFVIFILGVRLINVALKRQVRGC